MTRVQELKSELRVLEAFRDSTRVRILRNMLEWELKQERFAHVNSIGGSFRS